MKVERVSLSQWLSRLSKESKRDRRGETAFAFLGRQRNKKHGDEAVIPLGVMYFQCTLLYFACLSRVDLQEVLDASTSQTVLQKRALEQVKLNAPGLQTPVGAWPCGVVAPCPIIRGCSAQPQWGPPYWLLPSHAMRPTGMPFKGSGQHQQPVKHSAPSVWLQPCGAKIKQQGFRYAFFLPSLRFLWQLIPQPFLSGCGNLIREWVGDVPILCADQIFTVLVLQTVQGVQPNWCCLIWEICLSFQGGCLCCNGLHCAEQQLSHLPNFPSGTNQCTWQCST